MSRILALITLLVSLPLAAIMYLAEQALDLPFVPTDFMNWIIPFIPGDLITLGIDIMVDTILALNLGEEDSTAKFFETLAAVGIFVAIISVVGAIYLNQRRQRPEIRWLGLLMGLGLAIPFAIISNHTLTADNEYYDGPSFVVRTAWILFTLGSWGLVLDLVHNRWQTINRKKQAPTSEEAPVVAVPDQAHAVSRRRFLVQLGGATASITVLGTVLGELLAEDEQIVALEQPFSFADFPNQGASVMPAPGTRPEYTPLEDHYRIDISSGNPPEIDGEAWRLTFKGLVANEMQYSLKDLMNNYEPMHQYITLSCISNRIGGSLTSTTGWTGISLQTILEEVEPLEEATHLKITSADGFYEIVSLDVINEDKRVMLCYGWDEKQLLVKHGYPLRIYIPDRYGMKQPKWITDIEAIAEWEPGYWVRRGWDEEAIMRATSVIDTVAVNDIIENGDQRLVPIGGIAHAGDRGISKVEVQVNDEDWVEARLRQPLSETTWVIWRYDWPFESGEHTFRVRCYDGNGEMQITESNGARPSGATGIHSERAEV